MLTESEIRANKEKYINLIKSLGDDENTNKFLNWLENKSDFFSAPASTKYHGSYAGGLCEHSLNVYNCLVKLNDEFQCGHSDKSMKLVALLHDLSKTNFYELYYRNVKNEVTGIWEKVPEYKTREPEDRFIYGNHEQTSEYMASKFFPLTAEESTAILHHHAGKSWDSAQDDVSSVFNRYTLATLVHVADMLATFLIERPNEQDN